MTHQPNTQDPLKSFARSGDTNHHSDRPQAR
jgi:hypothetical protein